MYDNVFLNFIIVRLYCMNKPTCVYISLLLVPGKKRLK